MRKILLALLVLFSTNVFAGGPVIVGKSGPSQIGDEIKIDKTSAVAVTTGAVREVAKIYLPPGTWRVSVFGHHNGPLGLVYMSAGISKASAVYDGSLEGSDYYYATGNTSTGLAEIPSITKTIVSQGAYYYWNMNAIGANGNIFGTMTAIRIKP